MDDEQKVPKTPPKNSRVPGYGWSARLSGLDRPSEWRGFFLTTMAIIAAILVVGYALDAIGVW